MSFTRLALGLAVTGIAARLFVKNRVPTPQAPSVTAPSSAAGSMGGGDVEDLMSVDASTDAGEASFDAGGKPPGAYR